MRSKLLIKILVALVLLNAVLFAVYLFFANQANCLHLPQNIATKESLLESLRNNPHPQIRG